MNQRCLNNLFNNRWLLLILILSTALTACNSKETAYTPDHINRFDTADFIFHSDGSYSALTPWFNPFTEIQIKLELTSPSGRKFSVPGFFDGDGMGGMHGHIFKVRVSPDEIGLWLWRLQGSLPEFNQLSGSFDVSSTIQGVFSQGPVSILKSDTKRFAFANQKPVFLMGKFLDIEQPPHLQFTHTLFSENWSDAQREEFLIHQKSLGINKMNIYLANKGDYKGIPTTPWLGSSSRNIKSRFDLHWWQQYEKWTEHLRDEDIIAHLWFFADDSDFNLLTDTEREQLITYGMARLSAYANTIFTLALEWKESFTENEIRSAGMLAQKNNPWQRLVSVHSLSVTSNIKESIIFFDEDWLDFIEIQTGFVGHQKINTLGQLYRKQQDKPVILEEFSFGENNDIQRINTWSALLTAPAGIGTGSGLKAISNFLAAVEITKFDPAPEVISTGNAYAATSYDGHIIVYIYQSGPVLFNKEKIDATTARWFDPRKGSFKGPAFQINTSMPLAPPTDQDWALLVTP